MPFHSKLQLEEHKQTHSRIHLGQKRSADSSEPFGKRIEGGFALPGTQTDFEEGIHRARTPSQAYLCWSCSAASPVDSELSA